MAQVFSGPILTCEINLRWFTEAQARLARYANVEMKHADSRDFLLEVSRIVGSDQRMLFYLDAHWLDDLPLLDEMELIFSAWHDAVVIIDDFQVPDDSGYGFDDYGPGKALTLDLLRDLDRNQISVSSLHFGRSKKQERNAVASFWQARSRQPRAFMA
jgi:hypothetical protein